MKCVYIYFLPPFHVTINQHQRSEWIFEVKEVQLKKSLGIPELVFIFLANTETNSEVRIIPHKIRA